MNILKCFLSFMILLLYVKFNSAVDSELDGKSKSEDIQKELVEYENKIELMESTIKNFQANAGALRKCASLSRITEEELERVLDKIHKLKTRITTLKDTNTNLTEPTSCVSFGNDIQTLRVPGTEAFQAPCDYKFAGEGWTVIQRRVDDSVNFNRTWEEYKNGFGDLRGNFWLGLEKLHLMTKLRRHELYIQLENFQNETRYARYSDFTIGNEAQSYELLTLGDYSGNAGDALSYHQNIKFSTQKRDNDNYNRNCAVIYSSGWWFNRCFQCNLNGVYGDTKTDEDYHLIGWRGWNLIPLKFVQMMIRP